MHGASKPAKTPENLWQKDLQNLLGTCKTFKDILKILKGRGQISRLCKDPLRSLSNIFDVP